ncbi:MAG: S41 family peptidase, partial [Candidatus Scatosoma sp.]
YLRELCYPYGESDARVVKVYKAEFIENYVFYRSDVSSYVYLGEDAEETVKGEPLASLPADAAYIRLTQFNGNAAKEFDAAMARFKADGKKRLVLDLRENGGGDLDVLRSIASYFCKNSDKSRPAVAKAVDREGKEYSFKATDNLYDEYFGADSKAYVLADANTASASECLIGCMLDYGCIDYNNICLSYRNGEAKTYGKGIMQTTRTRYLWTSEAIKLTTARICWPLSGTCIHGTGVTEADGTHTTAENYAPDGEITAALAALL